MNQAHSPFTIFQKYPNLFIAFSKRADGSLKHKEGMTPEDPEIIARGRFLSQFNITLDEVVAAGLVHGRAVEIVSKKEGGTLIPDTDGLITWDKRVFLTVTAADCLPILIYHPQSETVTVLHAGWKGVYERIIEEAILKLNSELSIDADELIVGIGPAIGPCHYEVTDDRLAKFVEYPDGVVEHDGSTFLDIKEIARQQLIGLGVKTENIEVSPICTYCESDTYFSHRHDGITPVPAMMFVAGNML